MKNRPNLKATLRFRELRHQPGHEHSLYGKVAGEAPLNAKATTPDNAEAPRLHARRLPGLRPRARLQRGAVEPGCLGQVLGAGHCPAALSGDVAGSPSMQAPLVTPHGRAASIRGQGRGAPLLLAPASLVLLGGFVLPLIELVAQSVRRETPRGA